jgi:hypothetical protein
VPTCARDTLLTASTAIANSIFFMTSHLVERDNGYAYVPFQRQRK